MIREVVVVGAGGHAREVLSMIGQINRRMPTWHVKGCLVDPQYRKSDDVDGVPILGGLDWLLHCGTVAVTVAVGSSMGRAEIVDRIGEYCDVEYATLVDPTARVATSASVGPGSQVLAGAAMGAGAQAGRHSILNYGAIVAHECRVADFVSIGPGACLGGKSFVGDGVELGLGACVLPQVEIAQYAVVGAGAVVTRFVSAGDTVVGVPARVLYAGAG